MSPEQIDHLAGEVANATGVDKGQAVDALKSNDPLFIKLATQVVDLDNSREEWHADMKQHRRKIAGR